MSDEEEAQGPSYLVFADRAKTGRSTCRKCKQKIEAKELRMAKIGANPFGSGAMKMWHHLNCMFEVFARQRATTAKIESIKDIGGWEKLSKEDQEEILSRLPDSVRATQNDPSSSSNEGLTVKKDPEPGSSGRDDSLREFRRICADISNTSLHLNKAAILRNFIKSGSDGSGYKGDLLLLIKLLLPGVVKRIYNIQSKQIVKLFSEIFGASHEAMLADLEKGDVAETIRIFFEDSKVYPPAKKSTLTIQDVDEFLQELSHLTREEEQIAHFRTVVPKCTGNDLKIIIRLIKHDLRINAGAKNILDGVHPDAYEAFQASRDLDAVFDKLFKNEDSSNSKKDKSNISIRLLTPVLPMLAQPVRTIEDAMKKCPNGILSEVKYDGERVQVHKKGKDFKFFSRSLKPVLPHKVRSIQEYIPQAFPYGFDLILDSEILLIDTTNGKPLPFGTLGIHKKSEFKDANICLFVFDCIYYNGESLTNKPLKERKAILRQNMNEIPYRIVFSEMRDITEPKALEQMITDVIREGLEGLVLKDKLSIYEPGKRHWLKVKKDYLFGGAMADCADLVVLGAWYGTGQWGGKMSIFLMGCYDEDRDVWCTVTKVHTGLDEKTVEELQTQLDMVKISKDASKVPSWLKCTKTLVPDFVARDPKAQPVWEIAGAELTKSTVHTAEGISVRFPRIVRIRDDKDWSSATNLSELKQIYEKSKETANFTLSNISGENSSSSTPQKKRPSEESPPSTPKKKRAYQIRNPLPDVFVGVRMFFPETIPRRDILLRYFVAYGGQVLDEKDSNMSTHFLKTSSNKDRLEKCQSVVDLSWLWTSIKSQRIQSEPPQN